jgi:hypothetical protein
VSLLRKAGKISSAQESDLWAPRAVMRLGRGPIWGFAVATRVELHGLW